MFLTQKMSALRRAFALVLSLQLTLPLVAQIRDGGVDPSNLGKGEWIYKMQYATNGLMADNGVMNVPGVTDEASLWNYFKSQGVRWVIVKSGTGAAKYPSDSNPQFTTNLCASAHQAGILIFGDTRSYGTNIPGESAIVDYCFRCGADGFVFDAESEWETGSANPGITNGPLQAWALCSMARSNWPTKFIAHNPQAIINSHSTFPYKEFGYWCDAVMPMIYHFSSVPGLKNSVSAAVNWTDVNWQDFYNKCANVYGPSNMNGTIVHWTNAIKPIIPMADAYGTNYSSPTPDKDVQEFLDYTAADPNFTAAGGYTHGASFFRCELQDTVQWSYVDNGTCGNFPGVVNNIVIDDANALKVGDWTAVRTFGISAGSPAFWGNGSNTDTNSFGTNYCAKGQGTGAAYVQFTPNVITPGDYDVYEWHVHRSDASTNVPFAINYNGGSTTAFASQQVNSGTWNRLGRFNFAAGNSGSIRVMDNFPEPGAVAVADGLKLVFVPPTSVPDAPSGLTATAATSWQIDLAWTDNPTNENGSIVACGTAPGGPYTDIAFLPPNTTNYPVTGLAANATYYFSVRATNYLGLSNPSPEASATTLDGVNLPPGIDVPPQSQSVDAGSNATFFVSISGTPPISYQWRHNDANVPGMTSSACSLANVQPLDAGSYSVVLANAYGSVTSAPVTLTVLTYPPNIAAQPLSQTITASSNAVFSVSATGTAPLAYQWQFNNAKLSGATTSTFTRLNAQPAHAGTYTVVVTNRFGTIVSADAVLTVNIPPAITAQPQSQWLTVGDTLTFSVAATGTPTLSYQWHCNGADISGATDSAFNKANLQLSDAGDYSVTVSNVAGTVSSFVAALTVTASATPPNITAQPQDQIAPVGHSVVLSVRATGTTPLVYQWLFNGTTLPGATQMDLALDNVTPSQSGSYSVIVSNFVGAIVSSNATLKVNSAGQVGGMTKLWALGGGSRPYLTTASQTERGMAYNPFSNRVLVVSRASGAQIYVLNGDTGADLHTLNVDSTIVTGGYYTLMMIGAADDGAVYAADLTLSGASKPFRLYRWNNDNPGTIPTVAYTGNPTPDNDQRWGDSFDVRGAGTNTQVIIGSRTGTNLVVFTTANGLDFTPHEINAIDLEPGACGLGLAFGEGNTFWCKAGAIPLRQVAFDLNSGIASTVHSFDLTNFPSSITPIGLNNTLHLLAGVAIETPDNLKLYSLGSQSASPVFLTNCAFATDIANGYCTGAADFAGDRLYALDSNNGLLAMRLTPADDASPLILSQPADQAAFSGGNATFRVGVIGTAPLSYAWQFNGAALPGQTNATLALNAVTPDQAGTYSVLVTNPYGVAISSNATLTVKTPIASLFDNFDAGIDPSQWQAFSGTVAANNIGGYVSAPYSLYFGGTAPRYAVTAPINTMAGGMIQFQLCIASGFNSYGSWYAAELPWEGIALSYSIDNGLTWVQIGQYDLDLYRNWTHVALMIPTEAQTPSTLFSWSQLNSFSSQSGQWALDDVSISSGPAAPVITTQPQSQPASEGGTATFSVLAAGTPPLSYQWQFNGSDLPGATDSILALNAIATNQAGLYSVVVSSPYGNAASSNAALRVFQPATSLFDDFDPAIDQSQWWAFGGTVLATNYGGFVSPSNSLWFCGYGSRFAITRPINAANGGVISFQLRTGIGAMSITWNWADTSTNAILLESSIDNGSNWVTFAQYDPTLFANWTAIALPIADVARSSNTLFRWRQLYNNYGDPYNTWALDNVSIQTVADSVAPAFVLQPRSGTIECGFSTNLMGVANGTAPLSYQWWYSNTLGALPLTDATNFSLPLNNIQTNQTGLYWLVASNAYGTASSAPASLVVTPAIPLEVALDNTNLVWSSSGDALWRGQTNVTHDGVSAASSGAIHDSQQSSLQTTVTGPGTLTFWWKVSSETNYDYLNFYIGSALQTKICGEVNWTKKTYTIPAGAQTLTWTYSKDPSDSSGQDKGWVDQVSYALIQPPVITSQPQDQIVAAGSNALFQVVASSAASMSYQWRFNGTNIAGATKSALTLNNAQLTNAGLYSVVITNIAGPVISSNANLIVLTPLLCSHGSNGWTLNWSGPFVLQSSTNVAGPYYDDTNAVSPWTPDCAQESQRFFRLHLINETAP